MTGPARQGRLLGDLKNQILSPFPESDFPLRGESLFRRISLVRGQLGPDLASGSPPVPPISVPGKEPLGALSFTGPAGQGGFSCETLLVNSATPGRQEHTRLRR